MNDSLLLPRPLVNQILAHAQQHHRQEICGLIASSATNELRYVPVANTASDQAHQFQMDEKQLVDSMRTFRENHENLLAIVHSHPTSVARPSPLDIAQANYPGAYYLIISLNTRGVLELRAYKIDSGLVREVVVKI